MGIAAEWHERANGLYGVWDLNDNDDADSQRAARLAKQGRLPYLSVRFQSTPDGSVWSMGRDGRPHVVRRTARLISVSLVSAPAYVGAKVDQVRAVTDRDVEAYDSVFDLAVALRAPLLVDAIDGGADDMLTATALVRLAIQRHGATAAPDMLAEGPSPTSTASADS